MQNTATHSPVTRAKVTAKSLKQTIFCVPWGLSQATHSLTKDGHNSTSAKNGKSNGQFYDQAMQI
jgi:hypothetical protein